jgi:hypothetical protein
LTWLLSSGTWKYVQWWKRGAIYKKETPATVRRSCDLETEKRKEFSMDMTGPPMSAAERYTLHISPNRFPEELFSVEDEREGAGKEMEWWEGIRERRGGKGNLSCFGDTVSQRFEWMDWRFQSGHSHCPIGKSPVNLVKTDSENLNDSAQPVVGSYQVDSHLEYELHSPLEATIPQRGKWIYPLKDWFLEVFSLTSFSSTPQIHRHFQRAEGSETFSTDKSAPKESRAKLLQATMRSNE